MKNSAFKKESSVPLTNGVATTQNVENGYDFSKYTISLDNHHPEDEAEAVSRRDRVDFKNRNFAVFGEKICEIFFQKVIY